MVLQLEEGAIKTLWVMSGNADTKLSWQDPSASAANARWKRVNAMLRIILR
jgi:hypothetical protein